MDISIIMINYNTYDLTKNAIESIICHTKNIDYEIILIDNCSPDKSGERLRQVFMDKIVFVQAQDNLGTSRAFNMGLRLAKGKYILWLNSDIIVTDNSLRKLYSYMEEHAECGICGGNLVDGNNMPTHSYRLQLPSVKTEKKSLSLIRLFVNKLCNSSIKQQYNFTERPIEVGYITGADMMIRKIVIDKIGGFDEDIFMYAEESEFTFRMKKLTEYSVMSVPEATIQHLEGSSFKSVSRFNAWRFKTKLDGDCVYFSKCYGYSEVIKYLKTLLRAYGKFELILKFCFKKQRAKEYSEMRAIVKDKLNKLEDNV